MTPPPAASLLREWFVSVGTTAKDFAARLEVREETLSRWLSGRLVPSMVSRLAIEHVTHGRVPTAAWTTIAA